MLQIKNMLGGGKPEGLYAWKKLSAQGGDFIDYVVSDKETAYPDGGEKDGYWYERVSEGITPEMFGCTKMAIDTYIPSSNIKIDEQEIPHSLGIIPRAIIMVADRDTYQYTGDYCQFVFYTINKDNKAYGNMLRTYPEYNQKYVDGMSGVSRYVTKTNFKWDVSIAQNSNYPPSYKSGVTYTIYTFG